MTDLRCTCPQWGNQGPNDTCPLHGPDRRLSARLAILFEDVRCDVDDYGPLVAEVVALDYDVQAARRTAEHWKVELMAANKETERLRRSLKEIVALTTGPDRGTAAWQIEMAVEIANKALLA